MSRHTHYASTAAELADVTHAHEGGLQWHTHNPASPSFDEQREAEALESIRYREQQREYAEFDAWWEHEVPVNSALRPVGEKARTTLRAIAWAAFKQGLALAREGRA